MAVVVVTTPDGRHIGLLGGAAGSDGLLGGVIAAVGLFGGAAGSVGLRGAVCRCCVGKGGISLKK